MQGSFSVSHRHVCGSPTRQTASLSEDRCFRGRRALAVAPACVRHSVACRFLERRTCATVGQERTTPSRVPTQHHQALSTGLLFMRQLATCDRLHHDRRAEASPLLREAESNFRSHENHVGGVGYTMRAQAREAQTVGHLFATAEEDQSTASPQFAENVLAMVRATLAEGRYPMYLLTDEYIPMRLRSMDLTREYHGWARLKAAEFVVPKSPHESLSRKDGREFVASGRCHTSCSQCPLSSSLKESCIRHAPSSFDLSMPWRRPSRKRGSRTSTSFRSVAATEFSFYIIKIRKVGS